jgi:hypothetical protein
MNSSTKSRSDLTAKWGGIEARCVCESVCHGAPLSSSRCTPALSFRQRSGKLLARELRRSADARRVGARRTGRGCRLGPEVLSGPIDWHGCARRLLRSVMAALSAPQHGSVQLRVAGLERATVSRACSGAALRQAAAFAVGARTRTRSASRCVLRLMVSKGGHRAHQWRMRQPRWAWW